MAEPVNGTHDVDVEMKEEMSEVSERNTTSR